MSNDRTLETIRSHAKAILHTLPPEEPKGDLAAVLQQIKELMPDIAAPPWYLSEVEESDEGGFEIQTLAAHEPPHYEETVAVFYPGNHGTAPAELVLLLLNNLELLVAAAEKGK